MFDMKDMFADMLKKALPPEVLALLTEEKVKEVGEKANAFVADIRGSLDFIKVQNETSHALLIAMREKIEAMENDARNRDNSGGSKPSGRGRRIAGGGRDTTAGSSGDDSGTE